jgi:hypothetical protein
MWRDDESGVRIHPENHPREFIELTDPYIVVKDLHNNRHEPPGRDRTADEFMAPVA